jgi:hypothetical protein
MLEANIGSNGHFATDPEVKDPPTNKSVDGSVATMLHLFNRGLGSACSPILRY